MMEQYLDGERRTLIEDLVDSTQSLNISTTRASNYILSLLLNFHGTTGEQFTSVDL